MTRSARHLGTTTRRWVRGLLAGAFVTLIATGFSGCGLSYVFRKISPLHATGWSFAWPILPSQSARLEADMEKEERDRVPILDPIPEGFAGGVCLDPPSEAEVVKKIPAFRSGSDPFYTTQRNNMNVLIEKIGEQVDPCKIFPLAGACQLVHCHYKCTVYFDEVYTADYPIPFHHLAHRVEVVYIDKDHLRRCGGPAQASYPPAEGRDSPAGLQSGAMNY